MFEDATAPFFGDLAAVNQYNQFLFGNYLPIIRAKKCRLPLFANALNTSVVTVWCLHCEVSEEKMTHLVFDGKSPCNC